MELGKKLQQLIFHCPTRVVDFAILASRFASKLATGDRPINWRQTKYTIVQGCMIDCTFPTRVFSRFIVSSRSSPVGAARAGSSSTRAHTQDGQETHYVARGARARLDQSPRVGMFSDRCVLFTEILRCSVTTWIKRHSF